MNWHSFYYILQMIKNHFFIQINFHNFQNLIVSQLYYILYKLRHDKNEVGYIEATSK